MNINVDQLRTLASFLNELTVATQRHEIKLYEYDVDHLYLDFDEIEDGYLNAVWDRELGEYVLVIN